MNTYFSQIKKMLAFGIITISFPFGTVFSQQPAPQAVSPSSVTQPTAVNSGAGGNTSFNWAGYETTGGTYTSVTGTWTVPSVPASNSLQADATWVGIGGVTGHDLIQGGTQAIVGNPAGTVSYQAWYETLPQTTTQIPVTISAGNSVTVTLTQISTGVWSFTFRNNTTGQSYSTNLNYSSSLSSAEWIQEMPTTNNGFVPLDNFGSVAFTNATAVENGNTVTIAGANSQLLSMVNSQGGMLASTSALGADGSSFTVTRGSAAAMSTSGVTFVTGGSGFGGRGWRREGDGPQGFTRRTRTTTTTPAQTTTTGGGTSFGFSGTASAQSEYQQLLDLLQQLEAQRNAFLRNNFRIQF